MAKKVGKLRQGVGAVVSIKASTVHPSHHIRATFVNRNPHKRLTGIVLRQEDRVIRKKSVPCLVFQCDEVMKDDVHVELYANKFTFKVEQEGPEDRLFDEVVVVPVPRTPENLNDDNVAPLEEMFQQEIIDLFHLGRALTVEDLEIVRGAIPIDDDNEPAPENVPGEEADAAVRVVDNEWMHSGMCYRRMEKGNRKEPPQIFLQSICPDLVDYFECFFPKTFLVDVILNNVNENVEEDLVTYGELLRWIGLWFLFATNTGSQRHEFWQANDVSMFNGAPFRVNQYMSRNRFNFILSKIAFHKIDPPPFRDKFWLVRELIDAWNFNMDVVFSSSWISCLDESMSIWTNAFTCPGFMMVPRKPHPFGNEYHTICCGLSGIMFQIELVEGKDAPVERGQPEHNEMGKTVGLLLRLTKPLRGTGKVVILDSGFCVLKALIELRKVGVFGSAVIKKRRYWPKDIPGEEIREHFADKNIGDHDTLPGCLDGIKFHIYAMKDAGFVSMWMSTYGTQTRVDGHQARRFIKQGNNTVTTEFDYPEVISNHYRYRDAVDSHNAKRHAPIGLETTWATKKWENRVFGFILAITEINIFNAIRYFNTDTKYESVLQFRKVFAESLIKNKYYSTINITEDDMITPVRRRSKRVTVDCGDHECCSLPKYTKFSFTKMVDAESEYPQALCHDCGKKTKKKTRTFCKCSPGHYRCFTCYNKHYAAVSILV